MKKILTLFLLLLLMAACSQSEETGLAELTLLTHDSFAISEEIIVEFENAHDAKLILLPAGDTGAVLNQAILSKDNPLADILYGVDNAFMSRALDEDIFEAYESPVLANILDELKLDPSHRLLPVNFGDVCLNYDIEKFSELGLDPPASLVDLTSPDYKGLLVVENPATSSPGLAFLLATIEQFGTSGSYTYLDFWRDLRANDVLVTDGWKDAYYGQFSISGEGDRPLVVSYATSPPAEVIFSDPPVDEPPTASIVAPGTCFRQVEFVGILKGSSNPELAQAFIDFMLDVRFQEDIPLNMFVFPANENAELPELFLKWAAVPDEPATLSPADIEAHREEWIEAWTDVALR